MEGERSVGWPYFLSGELYGAGLRVMTAEWIIISLSLSLSLSLSRSPSPSLPASVPGRPSVSCKKAHPGRVLFPCKDMQSRTAEFDARASERARGRDEQEDSPRKFCSLVEASSRERCYQHGSKSPRSRVRETGRIGGWSRTR